MNDPNLTSLLNNFLFNSLLLFAISIIVFNITAWLGIRLSYKFAKANLDELKREDRIPHTPFKLFP